jgi:hypothetical protein
VVSFGTPPAYEIKHVYGATLKQVKSDRYALESNGGLTSKIDYFTIKPMAELLTANSGNDVAAKRVY